MVNSKNTDKTHQQGMIDGIKLWGEVCGSQGTCDECPIGSIRGTGVTCQDFGKQFPAKMLSILTEMKEGGLTFYQEYCTRFPNADLTLEELAAVCCRKAIFEGYLGCELAQDEEACIECWKEQYIADITEFEEDEDEDDGSGLTSI